MICTECNGSGEAVYYIETDRDENSVTIVPRKGICRTCNGSGKKHMTNADRVRSMSDKELAAFLADLADDGNLRIREWLQQQAEGADHEQ